MSRRPAAPLRCAASCAATPRAVCRAPSTTCSVAPARSPPDRYFRYGLPLHGRVPDPAAHVRVLRPHHFVPLTAAGPRPAAGSGLLHDAGERLVVPSPRYAPLKRCRRDVPRVFIISSMPRFGETSPSEYRGRHLTPNYRQTAGGSVGALAGGAALQLRRDSASRARAPSPDRSTGSEEAPRPEFALPEEEAARRRASAADSSDERTYGALAKEPAPLGPNVAREGGDKTGGKALRRKVLNTERYAAARYNNGATARRTRAARGKDAARQRAFVRALLTLSGAFYALAFIAFYFLSLA
ncbi:hypothetical protein RR46_11193 [Papilio xuthus]|uniref:Uncharacterized protein n=1 Tax=Papilio xuthus TaxID=66420 RepID=A0A194PXM2_PAPXU|nr:hypothetical protein RR46_11193 [Papilio xuthus]